MKCPVCQSENASGYAFCSKCGSPLRQAPAGQTGYSASPAPGPMTGFQKGAASQEAWANYGNKICPHCQTLNLESDTYCIACGKDLSKKKKSAGKIAAVVTAVILVCALGAGGLMYMNLDAMPEPVQNAFAAVGLQTSSGPSDLVSRLEEEIEEDWLTLEETVLYAEPWSDAEAETSGTLGQNRRIALLETASSEKKQETWGRCEQGWILMKSQGKDLLEPIVLTDSDRMPAEGENTAAADMAIYTSPLRLNSKTEDKIAQGETVSLQKTALDQTGTLWGKLAENSWVVLEKGEISWLNVPAGVEDSSSAEEKPDTESASAVKSTLSVEADPLGKVKDNYSGPACMKMILDAKGIFRSQSELAEAAGMKETGVADYRKVASALTSQLQAGHVSAKYTGTYLESGEITDSAKSVFLDLVKTNLQNGYMTIGVCSRTVVDGSTENTYFVITGLDELENGEKVYHLIVPLEKPESFSWKEDTLLENMALPGFFCYLS